MQVLLMRHGEAVDAVGTSMSDEERPLTRNGREELERACRAYATLVAPPDRLLHSPLLRACQSAELLVEALGVDASRVETNEALVPAARPNQILDALQGEVMSGTSCVALVGHEPHLGSLLGLLLTGTEHYALPLRKGMLVRVDIDAPQSLLGRLQLCLTPGDCAQLSPSV